MYCGQVIPDSLTNLPKQESNLIVILGVYFTEVTICTTNDLCCITCALVVCNICCLLQQPTTMTEIHKCQCCGCQSNSTDMRICMAPSFGNFHCLHYLKDLYSKFFLYQNLDLDEAEQERFAHMKKCHGEICKVYNVKDDWKIAWNHDRKEGDDDPNKLRN